MTVPSSIQARGGAWGAISIVNAIPEGIGAAVAIELSTTVDLALASLPPTASPTLNVEGGAVTPLLEETVRQTWQALRIETPYALRLIIDSRIPIGRGLKSSSAVTVAIIRALFAAFGPTEEIAKTEEPTLVASLSAHASFAARASVTGAFDDALASARGGVAVADVKRCRPIALGEVPSGNIALLWIPEATHPDVATLGENLRVPSPAAKEAVRFAIKGDYFHAMAQNTLVVERALGYDYATLRRTGIEAGAIAASVSGNGPAVAFIVPQRLSAKVMSALPSHGGMVRSVPFVQRGTLPI